MATIALLAYAVVAAAVVLAAWAATGPRESPRVDDRTMAALRAARRRSLVAIGVALTLLTIGLASLPLVPSWLGAGAAIAPSLAGAAGLAVYAATPPPQDEGVSARRTASLQRRTPWTVAAPAGLSILGTALALHAALLVFTGATSSGDERGLRRAIAFSSGGHSSMATPYPGWFYAIPMLVATALLAIATWAALRRIATTASLPGDGLELLDRVWRARTSRIIVGLATAAACFQLGTTSLLARATMGNALLPSSTPPAWHVLSFTLTALGLAALTISVASLTLAARRAFALPKRLSRSGAALGDPA